MKKSKRLLFWALAFAFMVSLFATVNVYAGVNLNRTKVTLAVKQKTTLTVKGTSRKPTWTSSNTRVATVSNGVVTAKREGTAVITAKIGSKKYNAAVTVKGDYKKLYKRVLETNGAAWYYVLDINKNGLPELISVEDSGAMTHYSIYTVYKGKAVLTGTCLSHVSRPYGAPIEVKYVPKNKGILCTGYIGGMPGTWKDLFTLSGIKLTQRYHSQYDSRGYYYTGKSVSGMKKVSRSSYDSFENRYFKPYVQYTMLKNTAYNRAESFR